MDLHKGENRAVFLSFQKADLTSTYYDLKYYV